MTTGVRIAAGFAIMGIAFGLATTRVRYLVELLLHGRRDPERFEYIRNPSNIKYHAEKILGQKKLFQWEFPGTLHALTFWGFLIVQVMLIESVGELFSTACPIPTRTPPTASASCLRTPATATRRCATSRTVRCSCTSPWCSRSC